MEATAESGVLTRNDDRPTAEVRYLSDAELRFRRIGLYNELPVVPHGIKKTTHGIERLDWGSSRMWKEYGGWYGYGLGGALIYTTRLVAQQREKGRK